MESIKVTFPAHIPPSTVKFILEGNMKENSKYTCHVSFVGFKDNENVFNIATYDGPDAFYLIGIAAAHIMAKFWVK